MILAVWGVSLAWLVQRVSFRSTGARLAEAALTVSPGAMFYRLSIGGQQVGYASTTVDTLEDSLRLSDVLVVDMPALGRLNRSAGSSVAMLDRSLHLLELRSEVDGVTLRLAGRAAGTPGERAEVTIVAGGDSVHAALPALDSVARALSRAVPRDYQGNAIAAGRTILLRTARSVVASSDPRHLIAAIGVWAAVAFLFLSSFFTNPHGPLDSLRTYVPWIHRAGGASPREVRRDGRPDHPVGGPGSRAAPQPPLPSEAAVHRRHRLSL